jgi:hypothetical protein
MEDDHELWPSYTVRRLRRHADWVRTQGLARLLEEGRLHPLERASASVARWRWRRAHRTRPSGGTAVFLVGLQRSGTNLMVRGFHRLPEFEVYNENHRAAFDRFRLRPDPVVRDLVERSRHPYVLLKPLCDSHRTPELLDGLGLRRAPMALWAYRSAKARAWSAVAKFGDHNLRVLRGLAAGQGLQTWQAQGLSPDSLALIRSFDLTTMSPLSAAALFWYVRNRLFFELGLDRRADVLLVSYDAMVRAPDAEMQRISAFVGFTYDPRLCAGIAPRGTPGQRPAVPLDPRVGALCAELAAQLDAVRARSAVPLGRAGNGGR